ncbi:FAD/NAD(P)-binding oxidoreductase, partial [Streptomyces albus]|uniref:FAD/NAD(P)-binding oxidoreductase n=1 Tax=Streptomyces albus TaxID=1888 RepID=UPI0024E16017
MKRHILVIGASAAGTAVVQHLRRLGYDGALTLVGDEHHPPYDRPPLSKRFLAGELRPEQLWLTGSGDLDRLATVHRGRRAVAADLTARTVTLDDGTVLAHTDLVVATGVTPRALPGRPGAAVTLKTLDDARALAARLTAGRRLVIAGGGFLGTRPRGRPWPWGVRSPLVARAAHPPARPRGHVRRPRRRATPRGRRRRVTGRACERRARAAPRSGGGAGHRGAGRRHPAARRHRAQRHRLGTRDGVARRYRTR